MDNEINHYDGLVRAIARRYPLPDGWGRADIEQEGRIGLWNGLRRYDPDGLHRAYRKETVLSFAIRTQIRKALRKATGYEPQEIEIDIADQPTQPLPIRPPAWMLGRDTQPLLVVPLETPDPAPSVEEQVSATVDGAQVSATLEAALLLLSAHQRAIIERRFGLTGDGACWTLEEIGRLLGRNKSNICRQQQKALATLRAHLGSTRDGELVLIQLDEKRRQKAKKRAAAA